MDELDELRRKMKKEKKSKKQHEEGDPPKKKRVRIAKACDLCVVKKLKCDGHEPCFRCKVTSSDCTYFRQHKIPVRRKKRRDSANDDDNSNSSSKRAALQSLAAVLPLPDGSFPSMDPSTARPRPNTTTSAKPRKPKRAPSGRKPWEVETSDSSSSDELASVDEFSEQSESEDEPAQEPVGGVRVTVMPLTGANDEIPSAGALKRKRTNSAPMFHTMLSLDGPGAGPSSSSLSGVAMTGGTRPRHNSIAAYPIPAGTVSFSEILPATRDSPPEHAGYAHSEGQGMSPRQVFVSKPGERLPSKKHPNGRRWSTLQTTQMSVPDSVPLFADLPPLPAQEVLNDLVRLYFENIWPFLPCIDKTLFLRNPTSYPPILLYSIYACAARFSTHPSINLEKGPHSTPTLLLVRCARLLPTVFDVRRPTVHHVQAVLNMSVQASSVAEFEQGRIWVGMALVVARMVGLCVEEGVGFGVWNKGIANGAEGKDAERMKDERRRTWYCCLAYDRFGAMIDPACWSAALDEGRDVKIPPPLSHHDDPLAATSFPPAAPQPDPLMSLYSLYSRVIEFRQHCIRKGVDPCDVTSSGGKRMYAKLKYLDGVLVGWFKGLPEEVRTMVRREGEEGRKAYLSSAYMLILFYSMRVMLNGPSPVLLTERMVASTPADLRTWMTTPCFLICTTSAGNMSRVLEAVLDSEGERTMKFASPLLWACIWKSSIVRAVSVRAVRAYSGLSVDGERIINAVPNPAIDPAAVVARETRELNAFRRTIEAIRGWWATGEARDKRILFEQVFHEVGFPVGWKPADLVREDEGEERVAKMGAVVVVREDGSAHPVSPTGSPSALDARAVQAAVLTATAHEFADPQHPASSSSSTAGDHDHSDLDAVSGIDELDVARAAHDATHFEFAHAVTLPGQAPDAHVDPIAAAAAAVAAAGVGAGTTAPDIDWDLLFADPIGVPASAATGASPPGAAGDVLSGGKSAWRPGVSGGMYGYLGGGASSPGAFWGAGAGSGGMASDAHDMLFG